MPKPNYVIIHKTEWNRIKRQQNQQPDFNREQYIKSINELSQIWIKKWPDTIQGHLRLIKEQEKSEHLKLIESVNQFNSKEKHESKTESITKARELLFENSYYGRQLVSALLESKTLEERDEQINFKNKMKLKQNVTLKNNEPNATSVLNANEMEVNEKKTAVYQKKRAFETAEANKIMFEAKNKEITLQKERERHEKDHHEDDYYKFKQQEKKITEERVNEHKKSLLEYEELNKQIKESKKARDNEAERIRVIWQNYHDRVNYRKKIISNEINQNKANRKQYLKVYENVKHLNDEKNKKYNDFIDKGIKRLEDRSKQQEKDETQHKLIEFNKRKTLDEENKALAKLTIAKCEECHKQPFVNKHPCIHPKSKNDVDRSVPVISIRKKTLVESLREREKLSDWNSMKATHTLFAERAADTLRECRYTKMTLKVIQNYRRENCLDHTSLPIANV